MGCSSSAGPVFALRRRPAAAAGRRPAELRQVYRGRPLPAV